MQHCTLLCELEGLQHPHSLIGMVEGVRECRAHRPWRLRDGCGELGVGLLGPTIDPRPEVLSHVFHGSCTSLHLEQLCF